MVPSLSDDLISPLWYFLSRYSCKCLHSIVECSFLLWNSQYLVGSSYLDQLFHGCLDGRCASLTWKFCAFRSPSSFFRLPSDRCRDSRHSSFALSFVTIVLMVECFLAMASLSSSSSMNRFDQCSASVFVYFEVFTQL